MIPLSKEGFCPSSTIFDGPPSPRGRLFGADVGIGPYKMRRRHLNCPLSTFNCQLTGQCSIGPYNAMVQNYRQPQGGSLPLPRGAFKVRSFSQFLCRTNVGAGLAPPVPSKSLLTYSRRRTWIFGSSKLLPYNGAKLSSAAGPKASPW